MRIGVALFLLVSACSKPGPEDATPEQICDRNESSAAKDAPPLARRACVKGFEDLRKRNPKGFECTRRCLYAVSEPELARECEPLCSSDPTAVCPGLKQQDKLSSADEITQNVARCIERRGRFVGEREPAKFRCPTTCSSKAQDLAEVEACWTKSCE